MPRRAGRGARRQRRVDRAQEQAAGLATQATGPGERRRERGCTAGRAPGRVGK